MNASDDQGAVERILRPFHIFAKHKLAGAVLLLVASAMAMVWANSPWAGSYKAFLHMPVTVGAGTLTLSKSLAHWINDGLMGVFFFVVGLEIKREVLAGELASLRKATLPILAAVGGMLVPAALYATLNVGHAGAHGWGIPMATDIAFALGVLALLGDRVPVGLKVFLTALAIVDDIGAIVVIALFYTEHIAVPSLAIGGVFFLLSIGANLAGVRSAVVFFILGMVAWLGFLESGVHATLAAVLMAMTIPARTRIEGAPFVARMDQLLATLRETGLPQGRRLLTAQQQNLLHDMEATVEEASAPLQELEHALVPLVTFLVLPLFALANAGVSLGAGLLDAYQDRICLGIIAGLVLGKQLGIFGLSWIGVRVGLAELPLGVSWRDLYGVSVLGGVGFTMSLFIGGLAFGDPLQQNVAKVGILSASLLSGVLGLVILTVGRVRDGRRG
jgi:NhaA family Na+:H+ antiporter